MTPLTYRRDIDGLRAIAVLSVLAFHYFPEFCGGGFVGVDIFFVISGYLISGIILAEQDAGTFSLARFYERRVRRIFPALLLVLAGAAAFGWYLLIDNELYGLGGQIAGGAGFLANFVLWSETGYFDPSSDLKPLLHLWSLGIEEQFYLIWPPLLMLCGATARKRLVLILAVTALSLAASGLLTPGHPTEAFYFPFTRFWELTLGALLAWAARHRPDLLPRGRHLVAWFGMALLAAGILLLDTTRDFPGLWALLPAVGAVLVIAAGPSSLPNRLFLGNRALVGLGLISYPLYLWHWPLLSFAFIVRGRQPNVGYRVFALALSVLLAWLTYEYFEKRVRTSPRGAYMKPLLGLMALVLCLGLALATGTLAPRHSGKGLEQAVKAMKDWDFPGTMQEFSYQGQTFHKREGNAKTALLIGDSHVQQYAPRLAAVSERAGGAARAAVFATHGGTLPIVGARSDDKRQTGSVEFLKAALAYADEPSVDTVVIGANWNNAFVSGRFYFPQEGGKLDLSEARGKELALASLKSTLAALAAKRKVYLLLDNPSGSAYDPASYYEGSRFKTLSLRPLPERWPQDEREARLREELIALAKEAGVETLDPAAVLCEKGGCLVTDPEGRPLYKDKTHLRPFIVREKMGFLDAVLLR